MTDGRVFNHKGAVSKQTVGHPYNYPKGKSGELEVRYTTSKAVADAMNARFPSAKTE